MPRLLFAVICVALAAGACRKSSYAAEEDFRRRLTAVSAQVQAGDYPGAIQALDAIPVDGLTPLDRMMIKVNRAVVHGKAGQVDAALKDYDEAIALEKDAQSAFAREKKAEYLASVGRR